MNTPIERPAPPRITKAEALRRIAAERMQEHGSASTLARLTDAPRQSVHVWPDDEDIPEIYARRLKDIRPQWFTETAASPSS